jgi:periplasmic divalent cation tolerance protein
MSALFVYVTAASHEEAVRIGRTVVEERLAACANIFDGMQSIYRWHGAVHEAAETVLIIKTRRDRLDALTARVKALHSYEVPCIAAFAVEPGNAAYFDWIVAESGDAPG